jgi:hypothetical protein
MNFFGSTIQDTYLRVQDFSYEDMSLISTWKVMEQKAALDQLILILIAAWLISI